MEYAVIMEVVHTQLWLMESPPSLVDNLLTPKPRHLELLVL
jgi:hypothetical protein